MTMGDKVARFKALKEKVEDTATSVTEMNATMNTLKTEETQILQNLKTQYGIDNEAQLRTRIEGLYKEIDALNNQAETTLKDLHTMVQEEQERVQNADASTDDSASGQGS